MKKIFVVLLSAMMTSTQLPAMANWSPVNSDEAGFHEIVVEDSVPLFRQFSFLHNTSGGKQFVCASMTSSLCKLEYANFNVILPVCTSASNTDCIEGLALTPKGSSPVPGNFESYTMPTHPSLFRGDGRRLPSNPQSPSVWNVTGVQHEGGSSYAVHAGFTGTIVNGNVVVNDFYAQVYAIQIVPGRGEQFDPNGFSNFAYCDFNRSTRELIGCGSGGNTSSEVCVVQVQVGGACGAKRQLPEETQVSLSLRLSKEPNGWYHGRLTGPVLDLKRSSRGISLTVTGEPVTVPIMYHSANYKEMPGPLKKYWDDCAKGTTCIWSTRQFRADVKNQKGEERNLTSEQKPWTPKALQTVKFFQQYTGGVSPAGDKVWAIRSLEERNTEGNRCYAQPGFKGIVSTNATAYSDGPPALRRGVLNYTLAAPSRYLGALEEISGAYDLVMSQQFAKCVYGGRQVSPRASVGVATFAGNKRIATSITSRSKDWIRLTARAFSY